MFYIILKWVVYVNVLLLNCLGVGCAQLHVDEDRWHWNILDLQEKDAGRPNGVIGKDHYIFQIRRTESFELNVGLSENPTLGENVTSTRYAEKIGENVTSTKYAEKIGENVTSTQYAEKRIKFIPEKYILKFEVSPAYIRQDVEGNVHQFYELRTIFQHWVKGEALAHQETDPMFYASEDHHAFWISWNDPLVNCSADDGFFHGYKQNSCYQKIAFGVGDIISQNTIDERSVAFNISIDIQEVGIHGLPKYNMSVCNSVNNQSSVRTNISDTGLGQPHFPEDFMMSPSSIPAGYDCIVVAHISETDYNYFCWKTGFVYPGVKWSSEGAVSGMNCTQIVESSDLNGTSDNYLCFPSNSKTHFMWSHEGKLNGHSCIQWIEAGDDSPWNNNFLCTRYPEAIFPIDFKWSYLNVPKGFDCIDAVEDHFCWRSNRNNPGVSWSSAGSIDGMYCTQILELANSHTCDRNRKSYLCVPRNSELRFFWNRTENCLSNSERDNETLLCATVSPSTSPTESPTNSPTESPSQLPSTLPTESPTNLPSSSPTVSPTNSPSTFPTESPTLSPTNSPTTQPSSVPTLFPTEVPSASPSNAPSESPTLSPTETPSVKPTQIPTTSPTMFPTDSPTHVPSPHPTIRQVKFLSIAFEPSVFLLLSICLSIGFFCLICFCIFRRVRKRRKKRTIREAISIFGGTIGGEESISMAGFSADEGDFSNVGKTDSLGMLTYNMTNMTTMTDGEPSSV